MKRIVALLLALVMALSATHALAEPTQAPRDGLLVAFTINIDRDKAAQLMDELKLDGKTRKIVDSALAVVNAASDQLVIAENGVRCGVALNEAEVLSLTLGKSDEGLVALSNLIPGHALTVSNDIVDVATDVFGFASEIMRKARVERKVEVYKATETLKPYFTDYIVDLLSAMRIGSEEQGEFVLQNGKSYNTRMEISFDRQRVADTLNKMLKRVLQDSWILALLVKVLVTNEDLANSAIVAENVPVIDFALYANLNDKGEALSSDKAYTASLILPGQTKACASFELHPSGDDMQALLNIPGDDETGGIYAAFDFTPYDKEINGSRAALDISINGDYYGDIFTIGFDEEDESLVAENALYIHDSEKPLATGHITILADALTLDLSIGSRRTIPLESLLFGKESGKLKQQLLREAMFSGLGMIGKANKAVPEFSNLLVLLKSAAGEKAAEAEEADMAKDAA